MALCARPARTCRPALAPRTSARSARSVRRAMSSVRKATSSARSASAHAGAGENILPFLKVGAGTDAVGMGYAYSSQVTDATATYWNPAGLARTSGTDILVMHNEFIADLRLEYAAVARTLGRHGVGLSFNGLFTSDLEGRDVDGSFTGNFGYSDLAFSLAYAFDFNGLFSGGLGRFADHAHKRRNTAPTGNADHFMLMKDGVMVEMPLGS